MPKQLQQLEADPLPRYARINTLKTNPAAVVSALGKDGGWTVTRQPCKDPKAVTAAADRQV